MRGEETADAIRELKIENAAWSPEVYAERIVGGRDVGIGVLMEFCRRILDGNGLSENWAISVAILIFKR